MTCAAPMRLTGNYETCWRRPTAILYFREASMTHERRIHISLVEGEGMGLIPVPPLGNFQKF